MCLQGIEVLLTVTIPELLFLFSPCTHGENSYPDIYWDAKGKPQTCALQVGREWGDAFSSPGSAHGALPPSLSHPESPTEHRL